MVLSNNEALAVLRFCLEELDHRIATDRKLAWYWRINRKIAVFFINRITRELEEEGVDPWSVPSLPRESHQNVIGGHPLLQFHHEPHISSESEPGHEWMEAIHRKVEQYVSHLYKSKEQDSEG